MTEARVTSSQSPLRRIGTASPSAVTPSTSSSFEPIMKSVWIDEWLTPRSTRSSGESSWAHGTACTIEAPSAMCDAAFSSKSVS